MENVTLLDRPEYIRKLIHIDYIRESVEENDLDPDEGNERFCGVCRLPIFSTPYYTCPDDLDEDGNPCFRHKCCCSKQQLPDVLTLHPSHYGQPLHLHNEQLDNIFCNNCRQKCEGLFYQCPNKACRFALDIKCCTTVKVIHRSHRHELTFIPWRHDSLTCGACGMQNQGVFYACDFCPFYLHQDCALLPNIILHKKHEDMQHPLALTFTLPKHSIKFLRCEACSICKQNLSSIKSGVYFCLKCDDAIHVKCAAISESANFRSVSYRQIASGLPHLPMKDEYTSLLPYLLDHQSNSGTIEEEKKFFNDKIHDHELVLVMYEEYCDEPSQSPRLCEACMEHVSAPFYTCPQCTDFYLHKCCANLPLLFEYHESRQRNNCPGKHSMQLVSRLSGIIFFSGRGHCRFCLKKNNGFLYKCQKCGIRLDVRCAFLPNAITYERHGKSHILFLSNDIDGNIICLCCGGFIRFLHYECSSCPNFKIHAKCALLPTSVSHKYDRHPLKLTSPQGSAPKDGNDENFCEICERSMHTNDWFYHCKECVTSFHVDCIPCVGRSSKIKTGRTIRVRGHDCPLTSIQMLTNYSYSCDYCKGTIDGKVHGIAFECSKCSYWLDDWCAEEVAVI